MANVFSEQVDKAVIEAAACRIAVYPKIYGWASERVQLELADSTQQLGETTPSRGGGHYLIEGMDPKEAAKAAQKLRGKAVNVIHFEKV